MTLCSNPFLVLALVLTLVGCSNDSSYGSGYGLMDASTTSDKVFENRALVDPGLPALNCSSRVWQTQANDTSCKCGSRVYGIVRCMKNRKCAQLVGVLECYCLYQDTNHNQFVGACLHGCFVHHDHQRFYQYTIYDSTALFDLPCRVAHRSGPLCGNCNSSDYGVPAYSFSLKCRECDFSYKNIIRYIAAAYGPLTVFVTIIIIFTISVNSAPLHGYIFVAQMIATSTVMRTLQLMTEVQQISHNDMQYFFSAFGATVYGFWNLDFFRFANDYYCLHPSLSTLTIISLDYLIALYPLVIIVVMYVVVLMHGRGYRVLVYLWRRVNCCFVRFRQRLNIRTTLVDAFGTFFSLSYVKFLNTTVDLLTPTHVWNVNGTHVYNRVYYDGQLTFMQGRHLPYGIIALIFFALFNILPIFFLLLYPRHFFQRRIPPSVRRILHPFMDTLLGIYRDGTNGGYDCRFFVVVYPVSRIAIMAMFAITLNSFGFVLIAVVTSFTAMLVAVIKPYKSAAYNTVDTILVTTLALVYAGLAAYFLGDGMSSEQQQTFSRILLGLAVPFPFFYVCGLVVYKIYTACKLRHKNRRMLQWIILCFGRAYISLVDRLNRGQEMERFPSYNERTLLIHQVNRDLNT